MNKIAEQGFIDGYNYIMKVAKDKEERRYRPSSVGGTVGGVMGGLTGLGIGYESIINSPHSSANLPGWKGKALKAVQLAALAGTTYAGANLGNRAGRNILDNPVDKARLEHYHKKDIVKAIAKDDVVTKLYNQRY